MRNVRFPHISRGAMVALAAMIAIAGCNANDPTEPNPDVKPSEALRFLRPAADAPPLANPVVSFYAKRGDSREIFIYYRPRPGRTDSTEFVRFRIPDETLDRRPDGTSFQLGDSILITVRVADPARLILDFQPSGLRFTPGKPARLKISFSEANDDLDGDGDVDSGDNSVEGQLAIWKQEAPGLPWFRQASIRHLELDEIEADLFGFTGYAIAY